MMSKYSAHDKYREAEREVMMRHKVYARRADSVDYQTAQRRIEIMQEIANDYKVLVAKERLL
jgi:hypothetical protein